MTEFLNDGYFKIADTTSPLRATDADGYTNLQSIDSVIYWITTYFENVLKIHLTSRWNNVVNSIGRADLTDLAVNQTLPYDPLPFSTDNQFRFPLLAVYRERESYEKKTAGYYDITTIVDVLYILPPLSSEQVEQMNPFLTQTTRILLDRTINGLDSNYLDGLDVWKQSGLEQISVNSTNYGKIPGLEGGVSFPSLIMQFEVKERNMPLVPATLNNPDFEGTDIEIQVAEDAVLDGYNFKIEIEDALI